MSDASSCTWNRGGHRPATEPPRGPAAGMQTWLMAGIAGVMVRSCCRGSAQTAARPGRRRHPWQRRVPTACASIRIGCALRRRERPREAQAAAARRLPAPARQEPASSGAQDPVVAERRRRRCESLFASNVVLSRRPDAERPESGHATAVTADGDQRPPPPRRECAFVYRRHRGRGGARRHARPARQPRGDDHAGGSVSVSPSHGPSSEPAAPSQTGPITPAGPLHRVLEGTIIDTVATNRLDGGARRPSTAW